MHEREHLRRLAYVWRRNPVFFITICTRHRKSILAGSTPFGILADAWRNAPEAHGWAVGKYVVMPDHVHFFARPRPQGKPLAAFVRDWKKWTSRRLSAVASTDQAGWQAEFFDHVLRSPGSYSEKWEYVRLNPVRAGLVARPEDWPFSGEIEVLSF